MSVDRTKVLEAAQKHLAKGAFDKAIAEFQKLVAADPKDVRTWLKIGDLQDKIGQKKEAIATYSRVADQYAQQGFFLKAVAVFKQILKLDPTRLDISLRLAEMYEALQLVSDALQTYEMVAAGYARSGDMERALATLGKMVGLDEANIPTRIKYAEALSRAGKTADAAREFEAGAKLLKQQGRIDDYLKVAERLLYHRPEDVALSRELSQLYLDRNDGKRALAKLQVCFKADPKDVPTLEMLATAFEQLGQLPKTISVYREIARIHAEAHRPEERALTLKRILTLDPGDAEARQALAAYAAPQPAAPVRRDLAPPPGAVVEPSRPSMRAPQVEEEDDEEHSVVEEVGDEEAEAIEEAASAEAEIIYGDDGLPPLEDGAVDEGVAAAEAEAEEDVIMVEEGSIPPPAPEPVSREPRPSQAPRPSLPPEVAREAQIAKLLTECEVFLRYGLKQKVVEQLRRVLEIDARHVEARERLKDVLVERGENVAAAAELVTLADQFAVEKPTVAVLYLRQAMELDPTNPDAKGRLDSLAPPPPTPAAAPTPVPAPAPAKAPAPAPAAGRLVPSAPKAPVVGKPAAAAPPSASITGANKAVPMPGLGAPKPAAASASITGANKAVPAPSASITGANKAVPAPSASITGANKAVVPAPSASTTGAHAAVPRPGVVPKPGGVVPAPAKPAAAPVAAAPPAAAPPAAAPPATAPSATSTGRLVPLPGVPKPGAVAAPAPARQPIVPAAPTDDVMFVEDEPPTTTREATATSESDSPFDDDLKTQFGPAPEEADRTDAGLEERKADPLAPISPEEFEKAPLRPSMMPDAPERISRPSISPNEVEDLLDEAEFFVAQGLFEEARGLLSDALSQHPRHPVIRDKLAEINELATQAAASQQAATASQPPSDDSFALAERLADELGEGGGEQQPAGSDVLDVEQVFAQFKKGVEQQVGLEDTDTHFDLGIAYKEMGLLPDAIGEFSLCLVNPRRVCIAETMIGLCHLEKGELAEAIVHYKKGLYAEHKTDREELGLYYELGRAYEMLGDAKEALYYYEKVKKRDATFRGVEERIEALARPTAAVSQVSPNPVDDIDAVFDDLMGKE